MIHNVLSRKQLYFLEVWKLMVVCYFKYRSVICLAKFFFYILVLREGFCREAQYDLKSSLKLETLENHIHIFSIFLWIKICL